MKSRGKEGGFLNLITTLLFTLYSTLVWNTYIYGGKKEKKQEKKLIYKISLNSLKLKVELGKGFFFFFFFGIVRCKQRV